MPSKPSKDFLSTFNQVLDQIYMAISDEPGDPPAKRQRVDKDTESKHPIVPRIRFLQKKKILGVGLLET
jgi:hypothetical protein